MPVFVSPEECRGVWRKGRGRALSLSLAMQGSAEGSLLNRVKIGAKHYPLLLVPMLGEEEGEGEGFHHDARKHVTL